MGWDGKPEEWIYITIYVPKQYEIYICSTILIWFFSQSSRFGRNWTLWQQVTYIRIYTHTHNGNHIIYGWIFSPVSSCCFSVRNNRLHCFSFAFFGSLHLVHMNLHYFRWISISAMNSEGDVFAWCVRICVFLIYWRKIVCIRNYLFSDSVKIVCFSHLYCITVGVTPVCSVSRTRSHFWFDFFFSFLIFARHAIRSLKSKWEKVWLILSKYDWNGWRTTGFASHLVFSSSFLFKCGSECYEN